MEFEWDMGFQNGILPVFSGISLRSVGITNRKLTVTCPWRDHLDVDADVSSNMAFGV